MDPDGTVAGGPQPHAPRPDRRRAAPSGGLERRRPAGDGSGERPARHRLSRRKPRLRHPGADPDRTAHLRAAGDVLLPDAGDDLLRADDRLRQPGEPAAGPRPRPPGGDRGPGGGGRDPQPGAPATAAGSRAVGGIRRRRRIAARLGAGVPPAAEHVGQRAGAAALPAGDGRRGGRLHRAGDGYRRARLRPRAVAAGGEERTDRRALGGGARRRRGGAAAGWSRRDWWSDSSRWRWCCSADPGP